MAAEKPPEKTREICSEKARAEESMRAILQVSSNRETNDREKESSPEEARLPGEVTEKKSA